MARAPGAQAQPPQTRCPAYSLPAAPSVPAGPPPPSHSLTLHQASLLLFCPSTVITSPRKPSTDFWSGWSASSQAKVALCTCPWWHLSPCRSDSSAFIRVIGLLLPGHEHREQGACGRLSPAPCTGPGLQRRLGHWMVGGGQGTAQHAAVLLDRCPGLPCDPQLPAAVPRGQGAVTVVSWGLTIADA